MDKEKERENGWNYKERTRVENRYRKYCQKWKEEIEWESSVESGGRWEKKWEKLKWESGNRNARETLR